MFHFGKYTLFQEICHMKGEFRIRIVSFFPQPALLVLSASEEINAILSQHIFGFDWKCIIFIDLLVILDVAHTSCYGRVLKKVSSIFIQLHFSLL